MLLTPHGSAAIAVVRIAGPRVGEFLRRHFSAIAAPGRCVHGNLTDASQTIDDVVVVVGPDSAFADVNLHGGPWVVRSFADLLRREGFEVADRTTLPLPDDAVDAAKVLEREMLTHLPLARTELALRTLLAQPKAWSAFINEQWAMGNRQWAIGNRPADISSILSDLSLFHLLHPPRVAIIGITNVGKSTLANQLFARQRSITADLPGTTRDWVGDFADIDGLPVMLVDTPGQWHSRDAIEHAAIQRSQEQIGRADLVILVLDPTQPPQAQVDLMDARPTAIRVLNKSDLPATWNVAAVGGLPLVATTGRRVDELRGRIQRHFGCQGLDPDRPRWWTERQRTILHAAIADPSALSRILSE